MSRRDSITQKLFFGQVHLPFLGCNDSRKECQHPGYWPVLDMIIEVYKSSTVKVSNALDSVGFAQDLSSIIYHHLSSLSPLKCRSYMLANSRTHNRNMSWLSCFKHISSCLSPSSGHQKAQQKTPRIPLWDESMTTPCNRTWRCGWGEDDGWGGVSCKSDFERSMTDIWMAISGTKIWLVGGFKHFYFPYYMGCHPSHWRTPSFFKMVSLPPTRWVLFYSSWFWWYSDYFHDQQLDVSPWWGHWGHWNSLPLGIRWGKNTTQNGNFT